MEYEYFDDAIDPDSEDALYPFGYEDDSYPYADSGMSISAVRLG